MSKIILTEENKWYHFTRKDSLICCDCSLAHNLEFKIKDKKIYIKLKRDDRTTSALRRNKEAKKTIRGLLK